MPYFPNISTPNGTGISESNSEMCTVNFGHPNGGEQEFSNIVDVSAPWVSNADVLSCAILSADQYGLSGSSSDHDSDDVRIEGVVTYVTDITPGVGFKVQAYSPSATWGQYIIKITSEQ